MHGVYLVDSGFLRSDTMYAKTSDILLLLHKLQIHEFGIADMER